MAVENKWLEECVKWALIRDISGDGRRPTNAIGFSSTNNEESRDTKK